MKNTIGFLIIATGFIFGAYVGIWFCFIGGIIDVIDAVKMVDTPAMMVAIGVSKVVFASPIGCLCALIPIIVGRAIMD